MADNTEKVFLSYIDENSKGLGRLKDLLDANGMTVREYSISSDNPDNTCSTEYIESQILIPRIQQCSTVVVYVSPEAKDSDYVSWGIEYAHKIGKRIVGVWAYGEDGCELPEALAKYADAIVGWIENSIIDAINGDVDGWQNPDGTRPTPRQIKRYSCE